MLPPFRTTRLDAKVEDVDGDCEVDCMPELKFETGACKSVACRLQRCLHENDYREKNCARVIADLKACCRRLPEGQTSIHCAYDRHSNDTAPS